MIAFQHGVNDELVTLFQSFVCKMYRFPRTDPKNIPDGIYDISSTRYFLFRKNRAEGDKLPPSIGAFRMHISRAYAQHYIWSFAHLAHIDVLDYTEHSFELQDGLYVPVPNTDPLAPNAVIEMVSCKSCKLCDTGGCPCRQSKQTCTDFCGCSDCCENTDIPMPENVTEDLDEDVDA